MKLIISFGILLLLSACSIRKSNHIEKKKWHWGLSIPDTTYGYVQAVQVDNVLYISGTSGRGIHIGDQMKNVYTGLYRILRNYGLDFNNVVKENLFTTDLEEVKRYDEIRKFYYHGDFPAATWIQVNGFKLSTTLVEVELIARLPRK